MSSSFFLLVTVCEKNRCIVIIRVPYRIKKWWFSIYSWSLSVSAVNAWRLRMRITGKKEPYLDFVRELVIEMFSIHGTPPSFIRKQPSLGTENTRYGTVLCL
jgi:hypothetical protein